MDAVKYDAFISYRHNERDSAVAREIQNRLERFRIPSAIQKAYGVKEIKRIFRDEAEFDIGSDLGKKIDDALAASGYLIVICSDAYNESKWCLHEIEEFLKTHDRSHVLTVLSEGEPPGIFPEMLCSCEETIEAEDGSSVTVQRICEPLACDYRKPFKEAEKTELPRLLAALIGCTYDELIMRREQYRRKRLTALTSVIAALSAIAVSYLSYSNATIRRHYLQTLIKESNTLSVQSLEAYDGNDRLQALAYALEALPDETLDRPVTPEAVYALQRAAGIYELPGTLKETAVFKEASAITDAVIDSSGSRLVYLDEAMTVTAVDLANKEKTAVWQLDGDTAVDLMCDDQDLLYVCHNGTVSCFDFAGNQIWNTPLQFMVANRMHMSDDGEYIAAADAFAVQVMRRDGSPYASYRYPEELGGYFKDVCWAPDGNTLAVICHQESGHEQAGFFDEESGHFTLDETVVSSITDIFFIDPQHLVIVSPANSDTTYSEQEQTLYTYENTLHLRCLSRELEEVWSTDLPYSHLSLPFQHFMTSIDDKDVLVCMAEDHLTVLDPRDGSVIHQYDAGSAVAAVVEIDAKHARMITADGNEVTAWNENGESLMRRNYPDKITKALFTGNSGAMDFRVCLLSQGNLSVFENAWDKNLQLAQDAVMPSFPEAMISDGETITVCDGRKLIAYQCGSHEVISASESAEGKTRILAGYNAENQPVSYLLSQNGEIDVEITDPKSGKTVRSFRLPAREYNADMGILEMYAQKYGGDDPEEEIHQFLMMTYHHYPPAVLSNGLLYSHSYEDPNKIHITDLSGSDRTVTVAETGLLYRSQNDYDLSVLVPDPSGRYLYTVQRSGRGGYCGLLISTEDGSFVQLKETAGVSAPEGIWNQDGSRLAVCAQEGIMIYDASGTLLKQYDYKTSAGLQAAWHGSDLLVISEDQKAFLYGEDGTVRRSWDLSFENRYLYSGGYLKIRMNGSEAVIHDDNTLQILDLSREGTRPVVYVPHNALGYVNETGEIIVAADLTGDGKYCAGFFRRCSVEDMIRIGNEILNGQ